MNPGKHQMDEIVPNTPKTKCNYYRQQIYDMLHYSQIFYATKKKDDCVK